LQAVSTNPIEINLSGFDPRSTALGKRARVTVDLLDFIDDDNYTDPYQAERVSGAAQADAIGYNTARGGHFAKEVARSPYYVGRAMRIRRGFVGDAIGDMPAAHYFISEWTGPDSQGRVQITAKDVFDLVDNAKAVAPRPSNGKVLLAVTAAASEIILTPASIGDEYPASGYARVGREVVRYTRAGDVMTLTERGAYGTQATSHGVLDVVQVCLEYADMRACDIIADLMTVQGPVPSGFVDTAEWQAEEDSWLGGTTFGTLITAPTGIAQLIGEVCQHGVMVWWDDAAQEVRFRVNRPRAPGEEIATLTDAANFIAGTVGFDRAEDNRVSSVNFWHAIIDPTDADDSARNYSKLVIAADPSASSPTEYGEARIKTIYSRWFGRQGNDVFSAIIAERLVSRYRDTPIIISAELDSKDAGIEPADLIDVSSGLYVDATGAPVTGRFQVNKVERKEQRVMIRAESYAITGRFAFWMNDPQIDYDDATDEEKADGAFWVDNAETDDLGVDPYVYF
jgi:hypothetical protein